MSNIGRVEPDIEMVLNGETAIGGPTVFINLENPHLTLGFSRFLLVHMWSGLRPWRQDFRCSHGWSDPPDKPHRLNCRLHLTLITILIAWSDKRWLDGLIRALRSRSEGSFEKVMDRPGAGGIEIACAGAGEGIVSDDRDIGHPVMVLPGKPLFFILIIHVDGAIE